MIQNILILQCLCIIKLSIVIIILILQKVYGNLKEMKQKEMLNGSDNENSKFARKKLYVIDNESKGNYSHENPIKFLTSDC